MIRKKYRVYGLWLLTSLAHAEKPDTPSALYDMESEFYSDSNDLSVQQHAFSYRQGVDIFHYKHEQQKQGDNLWGLHVRRSIVRQSNAADYRGSDIKASFARKFNDKLSVAGSIGRSELSNGVQQAKKAITLYGLKARVKLTDEVEVQAHHSRDLLFNEALVEDDNGRLIDGKTSDIALFWRPHKKIRVQGATNYRSLSDDNSAKRTSAALLYGISPGWPWIWAGVSAEMLSYEQNKNSYWTPEKYTSYGVLVDSSFPVNDTLSLSMGANVNRNKEDDNPAGTGYSISAGADWTVRENVDIKMKGSLLESTQETSTWNQDQLSLSVNIRSY